MEKNGEPVGGAWNFDREKRATFKAWQWAAKPGAKNVVRETPDEITREVITLIEREFPDNPGPS